MESIYRIYDNMDEPNEMEKGTYEKTKSKPVFDTTPLKQILPLPVMRKCNVRRLSPKQLTMLKLAQDSSTLSELEKMLNTIQKSYRV